MPLTPDPSVTLLLPSSCSTVRSALFAAFRHRMLLAFASRIGADVLSMSIAKEWLPRISIDTVELVRSWNDASDTDALAITMPRCQIVLLPRIARAAVDLKAPAPVIVQP